MEALFLELLEEVCDWEVQVAQLRYSAEECLAQVVKLGKELAAQEEMVWALPGDLQLCLGWLERAEEVQEEVQMVWEVMQPERVVEGPC